MKNALIVLIVWLMSGLAAWAQDQGATPRNRSSPVRSKIYKLEELTWPQIDALDRERSLFILPVGMIEQHGPHLPVGADTLGVTYEANRASSRVSRALPDWNVVMMPPINYGQSGANTLGDMLVHPGTYAIRQSTLRSLVADLGGQLAQNGFKWIFVHEWPRRAHPQHCDQRGMRLRQRDISRDDAARHGSLSSGSGDSIQRREDQRQVLSATELSSIGMDVHAGVGETSGMLAHGPDSVRPNYKTLQSQAGRSLEELREIATAPGWQGYLSTPAKATAQYGRAVEAWWIDGSTDLILRAVRGENMFVHARIPETAPPAVAPVLEKAIANETAFEAKLGTGCCNAKSVISSRAQLTWLRRSGSRVELGLRRKSVERALEPLAAEMHVEKIQHRRPIVRGERVAVVCVIDAKAIRGAQ